MGQKWHLRTVAVGVASIEIKVFVIFGTVSLFDIDCRSGFNLEISHWQHRETAFAA